MPFKDLLSRLVKRGSPNRLGTPQAAILAQLSHAVVLSKNDAAARRDLVDLPEGAAAPLCTTLSGGIDTIEPGKSTNLFSLLANAELWRGVTAAIVGRSLEGKFDSCLLEALAVAASRSAGRNLDIWRLSSSKRAASAWHLANTLSSHGLALGDWLSSEAMAGGEHDPGEEPVSCDDLEYFFGSGGYRASALLATLRANYAGRQFRDVVDLGAGIGFISCLVAQQDEFGVRHTILVEPQPVRVAQGTRLWTSGGRRHVEDFEFTRTSTQKFPLSEPVDLAIACQSLFYIPPEELPDVIRRVWNALRPGGLFVINEHLSDDASGENRSHRAHPILQRERLVALLATYAHPSVYRRRDSWARARDPGKISAAELSTDSFLVLEKPR